MLQSIIIKIIQYSCWCLLTLQLSQLGTCLFLFARAVGYTMDTMFFAWLDAPIDIDKSVELPQFTLENKILYDCSQNYTAGKIMCGTAAHHVTLQHIM